MSKFIHFRVQSSYSILESSIKIDNLIQLTKDNRMMAVCLSDRGNLFGALEFSIKATKNSIHPIHGAILNIEFKNREREFFSEILIIAKDKIGYKNLLKLVSYSFLKNDRKTSNYITYEDLKNFNQGIIVLSSYVEGIVGRLLLDNCYEEAKLVSRELKDLFGDRFYFEIMRHGLVKEQQIESRYLQIANDLHIPLIATNKVLFSDITVHDVHDVLLCIAEGVVQSEVNRKRVSNQCYFKNSQQMVKLFADLPEAVENTVHLVKRCYIKAEQQKPSLPKFSVSLKSEHDIIRTNAKLGLAEKLRIKFKQEETSTEKQLDIKNLYQRRLNYELDVICKMNFAGYFLIVSDFIKWSKSQGIIVGPGRGSGAGSIVAWVLDITAIDPIRFGLLFERFLNPERVSIPDFDIDFCQERREEVISYVCSRYGADNVGQIITFGTMQAKAAIKDVARVLNLNYVFANYLTDLVPFNTVNPITLKQAINDVPELKSAIAGKGVYNLSGEHTLIKKVLEISLLLEGLHRHVSTHAAGIIISNKPLIETVALYRDNNSKMNIVQYSMKYAELAGLVKFDFLSLQTLSIINKCLMLIKEQREVTINLKDLSFNDQVTYNLLSLGNTNGVLQFESVGMKNTLRQLKPDNINDIIALGALYRPGPMSNIPTYIACKHGQQEAKYLHELFIPILKSTYGVIIYQEQVMEIAQKFANYSLGAADLLRRAMGKKVKSEMQAQEEIFISGALSNGFSKEQAISIFTTIAKFAGYGFNKSHATAYAVISYYTAYLKANFTIEFLVSSLNFNIDNSDKVFFFLEDAKNCQIKMIPPCINRSSGLFTIQSMFEDNNDSSSITLKVIVFALGAINNVPVNFGTQIERERIKNGKFLSIFDFIERVDNSIINKKLVENLIKAGCFDSLHKNRNMLLHNISQIIAYGSFYHSENQSQQINLFSTKFNKPELLEIKTLPLYELAYLEFEATGFFLNYHPLNVYQISLDKLGIKNSYYINNQLNNGTHQLQAAGVIIKKESKMSSKGRFIKLFISDIYSIYTVFIFNEDVIKNYSSYLSVKNLVVISCDIYKDSVGARIVAKNFFSIQEFIDKQQTTIELYPKNIEELDQIINILKNKNKIENYSNSVVIIFLPVEFYDSLFLAKVEIGEKFYLDYLDINSLYSIS